MKKAIRLSRRAALTGLGGVTLGLPLLECMLDGKGAWAQAAPPKRYIVFFDGQSIGGDGDPLDNELVPNTVGANYDLKTATQPLGALKRWCARRRRNMARRIPGKMGNRARFLNHLPLLSVAAVHGSGSRSRLNCRS